jgi:hypothetical protein
MVSYLERLHQASAELAKRDADPLRDKVEAAVRSRDAVSTVALLDLIGLPTTTANARRVSRTMRSLGFVPIKSRRLMPGGYRNTVTRGWARPLRELRNSTPTKKPTGAAVVRQ